MPANPDNNHQPGFTIIELLVVIAIIAFIATVVTISLSQQRQKARDAARLRDMQAINKAIELFFTEHGRYPDTAHDGIAAVGEFIGDNNGKIEQVLNPYMSSIPVDPLHDGVDYYYVYDPSHSIDQCNGIVGDNYLGAAQAFMSAETNAFKMTKETCAGADSNIDKADWNIGYNPSP